jgi:hypothetical protein
MNIDLVNKEVSKKLSIKEKHVSLVNSFYWRSIYEHIYRYDERPINIQGVCVLYITEWTVKKRLVELISKIRRIKKSTRYKENSFKKSDIIRKYNETLKKVWDIRKKNKYTN